MSKLNYAYNNYLDYVRFDSSGKWCKPVKGSNGYYYPEQYTKEEFIDKLITDDEFHDMWAQNSTTLLNDGERAQIWIKNNPNHDPNTAIPRAKLYEETPDRKIKEDGND